VAYGGPEATMPKYLFEVSYSTQGIQGVTREGAAHRADFIRTMTEQIGGKLESFYFAFGETDAFVTTELSDDETAAAIALQVAASGTAKVKTVKLLTPEQIDQARAKETGFRPPGP
jgi:uncharacterized protein with GYD domain